MADGWLPATEPVISRIVPGKIPAGSTPRQAPAYSQSPAEHQYYQGQCYQKKANFTHRMDFSFGLSFCPVLSRTVLMKPERLAVVKQPLAGLRGWFAHWHLICAVGLRAGEFGLRALFARLFALYLRAYLRLVRARDVE